jgi:hypothetical protein
MGTCVAQSFRQLYHLVANLFVILYRPASLRVQPPAPQPTTSWPTGNSHACLHGLCLTSALLQAVTHVAHGTHNTITLLVTPERYVFVVQPPPPPGAPLSHTLLTLA